MNLKSVIAIIPFLISPLCYAQSGTHGGGEDGAFKAIRNEIQTWLNKSNESHTLENKLGRNALQAYEGFSATNLAVAEKVIFNHTPIEFKDDYGNKNIRICKNENTVITCNIDEWNRTSGANRYLVVFHEYLGVAGIEKNVSVADSQYPISSKILPYVKSNQSFELAMTPVSRLWQINCSATYENKRYHVNFNFDPAVEKPYVEVVSYDFNYDQKTTYFNMALTQDQLTAFNEPYYRLKESFFPEEVNDRNVAVFLEGILATDGDSVISLKFLVSNWNNSTVQSFDETTIPLRCGVMLKR